MKLIYMGRFNGDPESLPAAPQKPGAVQFREPDSKTFFLWANVAALVVTVALVVVVVLRSGGIRGNAYLVGCLLALLSLLPHELLHAVCFRREVYLYTNLRQGSLFVVGPEDMSKGRFIFMSLLPNLIFGFVPFLLFLIQPEWGCLGWLGALAIGAGCGDYINVFNALTQMPKGARTYLHRIHSYWYLPGETEELPAEENKRP